MDMGLVNFIRELGWPDAKGQKQHGNAAVLCYLSEYSDILTTRLSNIDPKQIERGRKFVEKLLKIA